jgi:hypothetical protein
LTSSQPQDPQQRLLTMHVEVTARADEITTMPACTRLPPSTLLHPVATAYSASIPAGCVGFRCHFSCLFSPGMKAQARHVIHRLAIWLCCLLIILPPRLRVNTSMSSTATLEHVWACSCGIPEARGCRRAFSSRIARSHSSSTHLTHQHLHLCGVQFLPDGWPALGLHAHCLSA